MSQKILLTGGNGFIGKNLYEILSKEYRIYKPNRKELNLLDSENVQEYLKKIDLILLFILRSGVKKIQKRL